MMEDEELKVNAPDVQPTANENLAPANPNALPKVKVPLPASLQEIVGSLLFASEQPLTVAELRAAVRAVEAQEGDDAQIMGIYQSCTTREIEQALHGLEKELERAGVGFRLVCTGGSYRLQTASACGRYVRAMLKMDKPARLTRAALETLAIIAYRQPITKTEMEQIRGVAVDTIVKTLVDLQLVRLVGKSELPGHPFLYGTTQTFLEHFGLASLEQLNELDPTLQRSNIREKAASYKKPVVAEPDNQPTLEEAAQQEQQEQQVAEETPPAQEPVAEEEDDEEIVYVAAPSDDEEEEEEFEDEDEFEDDEEEDNEDEDDV